MRVLCGSFAVSGKPVISSPTVSATNWGKGKPTERTIHGARLCRSELRSSYREDILDGTRVVVEIDWASLGWRHSFCDPRGWIMIALGVVFVGRAGICIKPRKKSANAAGCHCHTGVACSVIEVNRVSISSYRLPAGKYDIINISSSLVWSFWAKH